MLTKGKCLIFGAAAEECGRIPPVKKGEDDLVIAADGGLEILRGIGISPDIVLGDFDSLGYVPEKGGFPQNVEILLHPVEKDDTDTGLAIKTALERGYKYIELYSCLGGRRFDHSIATLQSLSYAAGHGAFAAAFGETEEDGRILNVAALRNGALELPFGLTGTLSVFAADGICRGVGLEGVHSALNDRTLDPAFPLGVSNSFNEGQRARISVKDGTLWIMFHSDKVVNFSKIYINEA